MPSTFQNLPCTTRSRLVHAWLLLLWLLSSHAFGALLIMAVAGITGDHTLKQCASHHGEVGLVLGHSSRNVSLGQEGLGREAVADASQTSQLEKPDHFFIFVLLRRLPPIHAALRQMARAWCFSLRDGCYLIFAHA